MDEFKKENAIASCQWLIRAYNLEGEEVYREEKHNLVLREGRKNVLQSFLGLTPTASSYLFCAVGSGSTAAAVADSTIQGELTNTLTGTRLPFTNTSGVALSVGDIVQSTATVSGFDFDQKVVMQATISTSDLNGSNLRQYGCSNSNFFPTVHIFNKYVASADLAKDNTISVIVQMTIRS